MSELVTRNSTREHYRWQQATFDTDSGDVAVDVNSEFPCHSAATRKHKASTNRVRGRIVSSRAKFHKQHPDEGQVTAE